MRQSSLANWFGVALAGNVLSTVVFFGMFFLAGSTVSRSEQIVEWMLLIATFGYPTTALALVSLMIESRKDRLLRERWPGLVPGTILWLVLSGLGVMPFLIGYALFMWPGLLTGSFTVFGM